RGGGKNTRHQPGEAVVIILRLRLKYQLYYEDVDALVEVGNQWSIESWTLDAPITYVLKKEYFEALELVEGGLVHLGDWKTCKVRGMVSVYLTMFDNRVFLLHDV
ncbi:hypothetical protein A2U01_0065553, partial [Trifolium medium]|nr:hypothetical protein [Trifolium medium]